MNTSSRYNAIRDEVVEQFQSPPTNPNEATWWQKFAPRWRNRVGIPRLTAENVAIEASGLLRSIHPATFRNDPELTQKLAAAVNAVTDLSLTLGQDNWQRFEGGDRS